ncbi:MAG: hypothetical protein ACE37F_22130 [Nannocystaceae bacterium]|nr:hypothetical protein [bacterium]
MNRWLVAPLLCALTIPSTALAWQPASPPAAEVAAASEAAAPVEAQPPAQPDAAAPEASQPEGPSEAALAPAAPSFEAAPPAPPPPQVTQTPPPPPQPTGPQLDKRAEPLLAVGLGSFAALYGLTAYAGAATIDKARDIGRSDWGDGDGKMTRNRGRALLIPVAGPFIAMHFTNSARRKYWQAVNGGLQAGSLAMAIIGARMYNQHRRAKRRARFTASASAEGAQVGVGMRF